MEAGPFVNTKALTTVRGRNTQRTFSQITHQTHCKSVSQSRHTNTASWLPSKEKLLVVVDEGNESLVHKKSCKMSKGRGEQQGGGGREEGALRASLEEAHPVHTLFLPKGRSTDPLWLCSPSCRADSSWPMAPANPAEG